MNETLVAHCGCGQLNYTSLEAKKQVYPGEDPLVKVLEVAREHGKETGHMVEIHGTLVPQRIFPAEPEWVDENARQQARKERR